MENVVKDISGGLKLTQIIGLISTVGLSYLFIIFLIAQERDIFNKLWEAYKVNISLIFSI